MLAGTLAEFSLEDIFQLLSLTKKSGALRVASATAEGRVYFRGGEVCFALADSRRLPLVARLVSAGHLTEERLRELVAAHRGGALDLARALAQSGAVDESTFDRFVREQVVEAVFGLMRLDDGAFTFDAEADLSWPGGSIPTEQLIEEASRRLSEWSAVSQHVPSGEAVLAMSPNPPEEHAQITLTREQWRLLTLVDGSRSVADLVDLTGQGEFATCRLLAELVASGVVEVSDPASERRTGLVEVLAARETLRQLEEAALGGGDAMMREAPVTMPPAPSGRELRLKAALSDAEDDDGGPAADTPEVAGAEGEGTDPTGAVEPPALEAADEVGEPGPPSGNGSVDRAQVARELASLGLGDDEPAPRRAARAEPADAGDEEGRRLTRDDDINKGLLLRLIDGVKGA